MLKVKIKAKNRRFHIPVPFFFLHLCIAILTSEKFISWINNAIKKDAKTKFQFPQMRKEDLKPLLKELSAQPGLKLVDTKLKDGTEVSITL